MNYSDHDRPMQTARYLAYPRNILRYGAKLTILMYHSVSSPTDQFTVSPTRFRQQLDFVTDFYEVIRLSDCAKFLSAEHSAERKVAVTFDDAYANFVSGALPVLIKKNVPATLFVPTKYIGGYNEWDVPAQYPCRRIMNATQILEAGNCGLVEFGSHTVDHVRMASLSSAEMRRQAMESKSVLEGLLGTIIDQFSYPYGQLGDYSAATTACLAECGYRMAVTTLWGTRNSGDKLLTLRRISLDECDDVTTIRGKIEGTYDWRTMKAGLGFIKRLIAT